MIHSYSGEVLYYGYPNDMEILVILKSSVVRPIQYINYINRVSEGTFIPKVRHF